LRVIVGVALLAGTAESAKFFLKQKTHGGKLRRDGPLVTQVDSFETKEKACCSCFKSKYAWPANAALGAAFAPKQTCDTCYVTDLYGIDAKGPVIVGLPKPGDDGLDECENKCDIDKEAEFCRLFDDQGKKIEYIGEGACDKLIADPFAQEKLGKQDLCQHPGIQSHCKKSCGLTPEKCGAAYKTTKSKVEEVHEWNWNCASGKASENGADWVNGAVEGEPESTRAPFLLCEETSGWYCPFEDGPDLKLAAGAETPVKIDEGGQDTELVGTMSLPVIDAAKMAATAAR